MSNHYCPVEGCDYPPDSDSVSLSRVRSHINATSEEGHDWDALKPTVLDQANDQEEAGDEQPGEQTEGGEGDVPDEDRDEYEEQWSSTQNGPDDPPGGAGAAASTGDEEDEQATSRGSGRELPVSTPVIVVGLALVVLVAFLAMRAPSGGPNPSTKDVTDEASEEADSAGPGEPDIPEEGAWA